MPAGIGSRGPGAGAQAGREPEAEGGRRGWTAGRGRRQGQNRGRSKGSGSIILLINAHIFSKCGSSRKSRPHRRRMASRNPERLPKQTLPRPLSNPAVTAFRRILATRPPRFSPFGALIRTISSKFFFHDIRVYTPGRRSEQYTLDIHPRHTPRAPRHQERQGSFGRPSGCGLRGAGTPGGPGPAHGTVPEAHL